MYNNVYFLYISRIKLIEMYLLIDNYDSFTYNISQYLGELGVNVHIERNDKVKIDYIFKKLSPKGIIISPGPSTPQNAGICIDLIKHSFVKKIPLLGICLGHQAIGVAFGGKVILANKIYHGKTSKIKHNKKDLFYKIPSPFLATRYHSLIIEEKTLPKDLKITAKTEDGIIMGVSHKLAPIFGVQFHPESISTENGYSIFKNFLEYYNE